MSEMVVNLLNDTEVLNRLKVSVQAAISYIRSVRYDDDDALYCLETS